MSYSHSNNLRVLSVGLLTAISACNTPPGEVTSRSEPEQALSAYLDDVESYVLTSEISGRDYSISVALPYHYADSAKTYPVLYVLDANGQFGTVVERARLLRFSQQIPQLVIVGIGYPYGGRQLDAEPHRIIDFFPVLEHRWIEEVFSGWPEPLPDYDEGGAPEFLRFITEELAPSIDAQYSVHSNDRAIYGHSGGGWFSLYALLEGQGAFQRAIVGSPSLWWGDGMLFEMEASYAETHRSLPARVFLSVGADEPNEEPFAGIDCFCMTRNFDRLVSVLEARRYEGLRWTAHMFEDENHNSVVPATISRGLRYIYGSQ